MEFLNKIVLPQSAEHIQLLHYLMILIQFLFLPFLGAVLIGTFLSLLYWKKGLVKRNQLYSQFSKDIINIVTVNKSVGIVLGIVPLITSVLIYSQLLYKSSSSTMVFLLAAVPLIIVGLILIYAYNYSLTFTEFFHDIENSSQLEETIKERVIKYELSSNNLARNAGIGGIAFVTVGTWNYITAISSAVFSESWMPREPLSILFSLNSTLNFIQFILIAVTIAGSAILFAFFYWEGGRENLPENYKSLIRKTSLTITFVGSILLPMILLINLLLLPKSSLSGSVISYSVITIGLIFISYHFSYAIIKTSNLKMSGQLFFIILFAMLALIIRDQMAMSNSTKQHSALLNSDYEKYLSKLKGEGTVGFKARTGEEIFQIVCSTCHKFDEKLVGPPYNKVLIKYEGKIDQLVAFIRNPVKVDPAFPQMPNLALRPEEAKNIAQYIMDQHMKSVAPK